MQIVVLLLLVAGLALLVSGLITGGTPLVVASIAASVLAGYAISRYRGRQPAGAPPRGRAGAGAAPTGTSAVLAGTPSAGRAAEPARVTPEPARIAPEPVRAVPEPAHAVPEPAHAVPEPAHAGAEPALVGADLTAPRRAPEHAAGSAGKHSAGTSGRAEPDVLDGDDPPVAETDPPLRSRGNEPVWVIDGRPRYHLAGCGFLLARDPEPVPLRQAVEDGFTPCALCDPDSGLAAGTGRS